MRLAGRAGNRENGGGDFGPYFQMQRLDRYADAAAKLLASGHAYPCYCTPERIDALRAQQKAAKSAHLGYDGHCRNLLAEQRAEYVSAALNSAREMLPRH